MYAKDVAKDGKRWRHVAKDGGGRSDCDWNLTRSPIDMLFYTIIKYLFHVIHQGSQIKSIQIEIGHQKNPRENTSSTLLGGFDETNQGGSSMSLRWEPAAFVFLVRFI